MSKPFNWVVKSPVVPSNHYGIRSETMDKVFDSLVPVQMQINSAEERSHFVRLNVELVPAGLSSSSFRKVLFTLLNLFFFYLIFLFLGFAHRNNWWGRPLYILHTQNDWRRLFSAEVTTRSPHRLFCIPFKVCSTRRTMCVWKPVWFTQVFIN